MFNFITAVKYSIIYLTLFCVFVDVYAHSLIECPNKVPEISPQPIFDLNELKHFPEEKAGISSNVNVASASPLIKAEIQAAITLVPCGQEVISVFTPSTLQKDTFNPNDEFSVAAVYTDEITTNKIKRWAM